MHQVEAGPNAGARPRVLIAEDDTVTRLILKHWIVRWGYEIIVVDNGTDAWKILQEECPPEVVIIDWAMPGIDGIELCHRLRDRSRSYYHYILMVTSRSEELDVVQALEAGADDCIVKPFGEAELRARLLVASRILALQNELIQAREELRSQAMRDGLTGLWNRGAFLDLLKGELERAGRINGKTGLLLLDLDHFKNINDTYGHPAGDLVLKEIARRLRQNVRSYDFVGRFGGEEFLVALPGSGREQLCQRAEAIREAICSQPVSVPQGEVRVSLSIGAAVANDGRHEAADMVAIADVGLYKAKDLGRNRAVFCERPWYEVLESSAPHGDRCAQCRMTNSPSCAIAEAVSG